MANEIKSINQHDPLSPIMTEDDVNILVEIAAAGTAPENQEHLQVLLGAIIKKLHFTKDEISDLLNLKLDKNVVGMHNGVASLNNIGKVPDSQRPSSVDDLEQRVAAIAGGDNYKGKVATVADLPAASSSNHNHKYWVTAENAFFMSTGTEWTDLTGSYGVYDGLDSESTTNALSANAGHMLARKVGPFDFRNIDHNAEPVFDGDHEKTWENMIRRLPKEPNACIVLEIVPDAPASSSASGDPGDVAFDSSYGYICIATDTWVRFSISTSF